MLDLRNNLSATSELDTDFARASAGGLRGQFWSVWTPCAGAESSDPVALALRQIDLVKRLTTVYADKTRFVTSADEAAAAFAQGKQASCSNRSV